MNTNAYIAEPEFKPFRVRFWRHGIGSFCDYRHFKTATEAERFLKSTRPQDWELAKYTGISAGRMRYEIVKES